MRSRTGCSSCRDRHVRCVRVPGIEKCERCAESKKECIWTSLHRFRPVTTVRWKTPDGRTSKENLTYDKSQVWVNIPPSVRFVTSDFDPEELEWDGDAVASRSTSEDIDPVGKDQNRSTELGHSLSFAPGALPNVQARIVEIDDASTSPGFSHFQQHTIDSMGGSFLSPTNSAGQARLNQLGSPNLAIAASPAFSLTPSWPSRGAHEARLLYHYIRHISPWIDVCDKQCHFGREVIRRAAEYPVIANAIFALAARHISRLSGAEDTDSPHYVNECLGPLINALEDPLGYWDENLLVVVIPLRTHEEMSDDDERRHLFGTIRLLNTIAAFAADGGLRESASWISVRQHIYTSLTSQHPFTINLTHYRDSSAFSESTDESWANRIIFIFASILTHVFRPENEPAAPGRLEELGEEVEAWSMSKPWNFAPLWEGEARDERGKTWPWPEMLMSHPAQIVGLQYYHLSKMILCIYDPRLSRLGFAWHRLRKESEKIVLKHLRKIIGLAISNDDVLNAMFQACHALSACGSYITDREEQDAAVEFLTTMQMRMGWRTIHTINKLREQWQT